MPKDVFNGSSMGKISFSTNISDFLLSRIYQLSRINKTVKDLFSSKMKKEE